MYLVTPDNEWQPISRIPVKVLSPRGYEVATATPRLAITNKGQLATGQDNRAGASPERVPGFRRNRGPADLP